MRLIMKLAYFFVPFIRLGNLVKRTLSPYINHFYTLKPSKVTFKLGSWNNDALVQTKYGLISGSSGKESWCWKGIPYATFLNHYIMLQCS